MKERNKVVKNKKLTPDEKIARLVEMGISDKDAHDLLQPDFCGRIKYADYQLTNNNAKIRSTKQRQEKVKRLKSQERKEYEVNRIQIVEDPQENRFQIFFGYKLDEEIRKQLHHAGYRYSHEIGCWLCYMNRWNIEASKKILESLNNKEADVKKTI